MTPDLVLFLVLGAAAGGFVNGMAGTGTALFALGFYLVVLPPITAVAIVTLMSVLVGLQGLWIVRKAVFERLDRLGRFILPGLAGVPIGILLLDKVDTQTLRAAVAIVLILYGGFFGFRSALPAFIQSTPKLDMAVGFLGGVLGGLAGISGAITNAWVSVRPWSKAEARAVMQPFNIAILSTTVVLLGCRGAYDASAMQALLLTLPTGFVAAQLGIMVFRRLSNEAFRRFLILLSLATGLGGLVSIFV